MSDTKLPPRPALFDRRRLLQAGIASAAAFPVAAVAQAQTRPGTGAAAIGLFVQAAGVALPAGIDLVRTSGFREAGKGGGEYLRWKSADRPLPAEGENKWWFAAADGTRFYLSPHQDLHFDMFGAYGDALPGFETSGSDDHPHWLVADAYLSHFSTSAGGHPFHPNLPTLHFGRHIYRFSRPLDLATGIYVFLGQPNPTSFGRSGTLFAFDPDVTGIIVQHWETRGVDGIRPAGPGSAQGSQFHDIAVVSRGGALDGPEAFRHDGWRIKNKAALYRCSASNFGRHGFNISADVGGNGELRGNANSFYLESCYAERNGGSGFYFKGGDANAGQTVNLNALHNRQFGVHEDGFLGNAHTGIHTMDNGTAGGGPLWVPPERRIGALTSHNGHRYFLVLDKAAEASTTPPSGTSAGNSVWAFDGLGGADVAYPAWRRGMGFINGGSLRATNPAAQNVFVGCYAELGQAPPRFTMPTLLIGGNMAQTARGGSALFGSQAGLTTYGGFAARTSLDGSEVHSTLEAGGPTFQHQAWAPLSFQWRWHVPSRNLSLTYANSDNYLISILGPANSVRFGRAAPPAAGVNISRLFVGGGDQGRQVAVGSVPAEGQWARGDIIFNAEPAIGQPSYWQCVAAGEPGTWAAGPVLR